MRIAKAGITGLSATETVAKALLVETKMTGNPTFTTPDPPLADLTDGREAVELALVEAAGGDHAKVYAKNLAVASLQGLLVLEAHYVTTVSAGDVIKILSSGFEPRKLSTPIGPLPAPTDLIARTGELPGELALRWSPEHGADIYEVFINTADPDDAGKWLLFGFSSKASFLATGLEPGKPAWFRVVAIGTAGASPASDPAKGYAAQNP